MIKQIKLVMFSNKSIITFNQCSLLSTITTWKVSTTKEIQKIIARHGEINLKTGSMCLVYWLTSMLSEGAL